MSSNFARTILLDTEFSPRPGERVRPACAVFSDLKTGDEVRVPLWGAEGKVPPPIHFGKDDLLVAYSAGAELSVFIAMNWPLPENVLDLFVEFRNATNGVLVPGMWSLASALEYYQVEGVDIAEKAPMLTLAIRGGPYTPEETNILFNGCARDVAGLRRLLGAMANSIDWPRALIRGRWVRDAAQIEDRGVPLNMEVLTPLKSKWHQVQLRLAQTANLRYPGIFVGKSFSRSRFDRHLRQAGITWPRGPDGQLILEADVWDEMVDVHPSLRRLRDLRHAIVQMRAISLPVGTDGRARTSLGIFRARSGRSQPRASEFIFCMPKWMRHLVQPTPGTALAYIDWRQQEFGICAALSKDAAMLDAYKSGDPYLAFAIQAGAAPPDATEETHRDVRSLYKTCGIAALYGIGAGSLSRRIQRPMSYAAELLERHRRTYPEYWAWSDRISVSAAMTGQLQTRLGWTQRVALFTTDAGLRNFPVQGNGAELMRLAARHGHDAGVEVLACVHDAFLVQAPLDKIDDAVRRMESAMGKASAYLLDGLVLRTKVEIFRHPAHFVDPDGAEMWALVLSMLGLTG